MDLAQVLSAMEPGGIGGASAVEKDMDVVLYVENCARFNGVLLLIIGLREFVLYIKFPVYSIDFRALFLFGIVASQARRNAISTNVVTISAGKFAFIFKSNYVHFC